MLFYSNKSSEIMILFNVFISKYTLLFSSFLINFNFHIRCCTDIIVIDTIILNITISSQRCTFVSTSKCTVYHNIFNLFFPIYFFLILIKSLWRWYQCFKSHSTVFLIIFFFHTQICI